MIEFAAEPYSPGLVEEMLPLWREHHKENAQVPGADLDPHLSMYQFLASAGVLRIYSARNGIGLVGYQVLTITSHPHFQTKKQAVMDILFLTPELRLGWLGYKFLKFVDEQLRKEGVDLIFRSIDARKDFGPVLERIGYRLADLNFMRSL